jgi:hypothetical protein
VFNTWDRLELNEFAHTVIQALALHFPSDPPHFLARTPHGYFDPSAISGDLAGAGFEARPRVETRAERSRAPEAMVAAIAYCQGTPMRGEIEARSSGGLADATAACTAAIAARFGGGPIEGRIQAHVVTAQG